MKQSLISKRYSRALFKLTDNSIERSRKYLEVLENLRDLFDESKIRRVLVSPVIPKDLKKEILDYSISKSNGDKIIKNFIHNLVMIGRTEIIGDLYQSFKDIINRVDGVVEATLTTVVPVETDYLDKIVEMIESRIKSRVLLTQDIDTSILGGFVVKIGNRVIDLSLRTKLEGIIQKAVR